MNLKRLSLTKIAKDYNVKLGKIDDNGMDRDLVGELNYGVSYIPQRLIFLGDFESIDIKVCTFFHELGHILDTGRYNCNKPERVYLMENRAWNIGFEKMVKYGITPTKPMVNFKEFCLVGYKENII